MNKIITNVTRTDIDRTNKALVGDWNEAFATS